MSTHTTLRGGSDRGPRPWWRRRCCMVAPAGASQAITSFNASVSTSQAGGHPDFSFEFALANPGRTGGRQGRRRSMLPRGCSETRTRSRAAPRATSPCSSARPPRRSGSSRSAPTTRATRTTCSARRRSTTSSRRKKRRRSASRSSSRPSRSRSAPRSRCGPASDYGLRFSVSGLTQLIPLAGRQNDDLGLPGRRQQQRRPVRQRARRATPAGCPGLEDDQPATGPHPAGTAESPDDQQPDRLHRRTAAGDASAPSPTRTRATQPTRE